MIGYSTREVAEILGLSPSQVRTYARTDLLTPARGPRRSYRFRFRDVVLLRAVRDLQAARVPPRKIRRALSRLRERLPEGRSLSSVRIATDGERVLVHDDGAVWDAESDQLVIDFPVSELADRAAPFARGTVREERDRDPALDADAWYNIGIDLEAVAVEEAARAYREALEADPGHARALINLGRLLHVEGDPAGAAALYRRALASEPENPVAAYDLAVALEDVGDVDGAIGLYCRAVRLEPGHADAHHNLARLYERTGNERKAFRHLLRYRSLVGSG